ncbi:MAG: SIS domain-containing protein [Erysipelotrichaceae bacterium]|nr:SIS domain-containing protein [Erysipelotrichaceae bacterium]
MMMFFRDECEWKEKNAYHTASEIFQQPGTWRKTEKLVGIKKEAVNDFVSAVTDHTDFDIILTGAGTSEFVGNALMPVLQKAYGYHVKSFATTDITSDPESYLPPEKPVLLVSFARSGNSPESLATVQLAEQICRNVRHLIITCSENGALASWSAERKNCFLVLLPPETNDAGFAMTSSFTNMYLAAYLALMPRKQWDDKVERTAVNGEFFLEKGWKKFGNLIETFDFDRIVYLGSGPLKGVAQECALKMCELTQGAVDTVFNSPMGFRHGPKSVIHDRTLTVLFLSDNDYTRKYERDLIMEMAREKKGNKIVVVASCDDPVRVYADRFVSLRNEERQGDAWNALVFVMAGQLTGMLKSVRCGIMPDDPCPSGEVNRVVQGVVIHPYR